MNRAYPGSQPRSVSSNPGFRSAQDEYRGLAFSQKPGDCLDKVECMGPFGRIVIAKI